MTTDAPSLVTDVAARVLSDLAACPPMDDEQMRALVVGLVLGAEVEDAMDEITRARIASLERELANLLTATMGGLFNPEEQAYSDALNDELDRLEGRSQFPRPVAAGTGAADGAVG